MKKIILAPDSFKGTMSSRDICEILTKGIGRRFPTCEVVAVPAADGGEGTVDCFLAARGGQRVAARAHGPFGEPLEACYGVLPDGTAVVEMAACAGLPLAEGRLDPERTTTWGVGELLLHAARAGAGRIVLGLGGSCTNDGGAGAAAACGVRFLDAAGAAFVPTGGTLARVRRMDRSGLAPEVRDVPLTIMCDIDNPLCGEAGAAQVFAPQKGADAAAVARLDAGLRAFAGAIRESLGADILHLPGAGAAGGMGGGLSALLGGTLQMGIDALCDAVDFPALLSGADLVITGEGRIDAQSARGKVVAGIAARARAQGVPVVALVGDVGDGAEAACALGVTAIFSINRVAADFSLARARCRQDLADTADHLLRLLAAFGA